MILTRVAVLAAALLSLARPALAVETTDRSTVESIVERAIRPMMAENAVPGAAVGLSVGGSRYVFCYGVASRESGAKVTEETLFEVGSLSKTFTATLASLGVVEGRLSLSDAASKDLPAIGGTAFDHISLLDLATFTAGGLPLQFPDAVKTDREMIDYLRGWTPDYPPGTHRLYSNPSIGLFGFLAAKSMGAPFDALMEGRLLPALGLTHTFIHVPEAERTHYAFGYTKADKPIRVSPGPLDSEAYGIKSTIGDMLRFVEMNLDPGALDPALRRAIEGTHVGYFDVGPMTQGLGWEQVRTPASLDDLLAANASDMILKPHAVKALPRSSPRTDALFDKTGSTNGFGGYALFVPSRRIGLVVLANKNVPIPARIKAVYAILDALGG